MAWLQSTLLDVQWKQLEKWTPAANAHFWYDAFESLWIESSILGASVFTRVSVCVFFWCCCVNCTWLNLFWLIGNHFSTCCRFSRSLSLTFIRLLISSVLMDFPSNSTPALNHWKKTIFCYAYKYTWVAVNKYIITDIPLMTNNHIYWNLFHQQDRLAVCVFFFVRSAVSFQQLWFYQ